MGEYFPLYVYELGREDKRSQTDVWAFVLYSALQHGVDYNGHICGNSPAPSDLTINMNEWKTTRYVWYPFVFNSMGNFFTDAIHTGICVKECSSVGEYVWTYGGSISSFTAFRVIYNASVQSWRCVPDINTLECENSKNCDSHRKVMKSLISDIPSTKNFLFGLLRSLLDKWFVHFTTFFFTVTLSFLWAYSMQCMLKPLMVLVSVVLLLITAVFSSLALWQFNRTSGSFRFVWLSLSILLFVFSVMYTTILIFFSKEDYFGLFNY
ncbi:hypothetical protein LSM04_002437 [Trypanosoma melophagium]|uniref:uncharacterized protein n=1 Tax=Trypanosoma melophagium TaxID=715481 RepID=UPI003519E8C9|nr:hypothetical protein LSM04_002437 [Trypanosoma melophagium]